MTATVMATVRRLLNRTALLSLLTLALAAVVAWQGAIWLQDRRDDDRRDAALELAQAQVFDLTTLDSTTVDAKVKAMGERLSGDFKRQFDGFSKTFADVVTGDAIRAEGEVRSVAVSEIDEESASVIVATSVEVTHGKRAKATQRDYRMRVSLDRSGDDWLITGMEFVR